ncbi:helix-turn-helix domain-containing protein [Streptomyces yunnanensis]|uniref:helix-turn-helix domain-containing protein n=1 Tax=Streptomyces yunnanensis TaxID=156453 RepID=UPI0009369F14|nr:helix-turn-helix transcriptional regulator [Streptomyces yunnanensis]
MDALGKLIERVMDERGWSLSTLARRSDLSISTLHSWKSGDRATGTRGPSPSKLRQLAEGAGLSVSEVFEAAGRYIPAELAPEEERRFLHLLRSISPEDRRVLEATMTAMQERKPQAQTGN